jgi:hypothetical protein
MRRIVMLLTVVALMVGMLAMSVAPVWAHNVTCVGGPRTFSQTVVPGTFPDEDSDGVVCGTIKHDGSVVFKDDHGFPNGH